MEEILTHRGQGMMEERRKIAQEALERVIVFRVQSSADLTSRFVNYSMECCKQKTIEFHRLVLLFL